MLIFLRITILLLFTLYLTLDEVKAQSMNDIGTFGAGTFSSSGAISGDGSVIVGRGNDVLDFKAFKRLEGGSLTDLGTLGGNDSGAHGVSTDGSVIVGYSNNGTFNRAFKKIGAAAMTDLGTLGGNTSIAYGVSGDGTITVGQSNNGTFERAFQQIGVAAMTDLGTLGGNTASARAISRDGTVIVGQSNNGSFDRAFKKIGVAAMTDLGTLGGNTSIAYGVSSDGSVVVGQSNNGSFERAFKKVGAAAMTDLGHLGGNTSTARDVSADGSIVIGDSLNGSAQQRAFKHTDSGGMVDIGTLGGATSIAYGISDDGTVIVGESLTAGGATHAFVFKKKLVDLTNTKSAISQSGNQLNSLMNLKYITLNNALKQDCLTIDSDNCLGIGIRYSGVNNYLFSEKSNGAVDEHHASEQSVNLTFAHQITTFTKAGFIVDGTLASQSPEDSKNFDVKDPVPMLGAFFQISSGVRGDGLNLRLSGAYSSAKTEITRDNSLANTEVGVGDSHIKSTAGMAEIFLNQKLTENIRVIPRIGLRHTKVVRDGYLEDNGVDFPIDFEELKLETTTAIAGVTTKFNFTRNFGIEIGGGVEHNINRKVDGFRGKIDGLGEFNLEAPKLTNTNPFGNLGFYLNVGKASQISLGAHYSKQPLNEADGVTGYLNLSIGFVGEKFESY